MGWRVCAASLVNRWHVQRATFSYFVAAGEFESLRGHDEIFGRRNTSTFQGRGAGQRVALLEGSEGDKGDEKEIERTRKEQSSLLPVQKTS